MADSMTSLRAVRQAARGTVIPVNPSSSTPSSSSRPPSYGDMQGKLSRDGSHGTITITPQRPVSGGSHGTITVTPHRLGSPRRSSKGPAPSPPMHSGRSPDMKKYSKAPSPPRHSASSPDMKKYSKAPSPPRNKGPAPPPPMHSASSPNMLAAPPVMPGDAPPPLPPKQGTKSNLTTLLAEHAQTGGFKKAKAPSTPPSTPQGQSRGSVSGSSSRVKKPPPPTPEHDSGVDSASCSSSGSDSQKPSLPRFQTVALASKDYKQRSVSTTSQRTVSSTSSDITHDVEKFYISEGYSETDSSPQVDKKTSKETGIVNNPDECFAGRRDVLDTQSDNKKFIKSGRGTIRGFKDRVRAGIATFIEESENQTKQRNFAADKGKVVFYTTSVRILRGTLVKCQHARKILQTLMIRFDERDLFMNPEAQIELLERTGMDRIVVPQIFVDNQWIGSMEELESLNESGELRTILRTFKRLTAPSTCGSCGGYRFVPCNVCHGSKKSLSRNNLTEQFVVLRCMQCDSSGLQRCTDCTDQ